MTITVCDNGARKQLGARLLASKFTHYYGAGGDRMRCAYRATIAQTDDGRMWLNHPRTPKYPEEISCDAHDWLPVRSFPQCIPNLEDLIDVAQSNATDQEETRR
jgi:hypothetical protein